MVAPIGVDDTKRVPVGGIGVAVGVVVLDALPFEFDTLCVLQPAEKMNKIKIRETAI
jgi:hypothetical protein